MGIVTLKGLTKTYQQGDAQVIAVNNVSFNVDQGDFVAIVGQSGSGKTTLLNMIGCIDRPTIGNVEIDDVNVMTLSDDQLAIIRRQKIGYIFQDFNLIPILTTEENIIMPVLLDSAKVDEGYLNQLAQLLGLSNRMKHLPSELSGGQRQRVAIARALINHPRIILADEPTGNLDKKSADEIMELLLSINKLGNTILLVTHNEGYADMCQRKIRISDGCAVEE